MKKIILLVMTTIIGALFFLSFVEKEQPVSNTQNKSIQFSLYNIPNDLKKVSELSTREKDIICATSISLVNIDNKQKILPSLSKETKVKDDGIEYEFIFDENKKWSNGERITPDDYILFLKDIIKNSEEEDIKPLLNIYGAKDYKTGLTNFENGVAIRKGENSIVIRLNKKDDNFLKELSKPQYRLRKNINLWDNIRINYGKIIYSGSYKIEYMDKNQIKLKPNNQDIMEIDFKKEENSELAMAAFDVGERDVVLDPPKNVLDRLKSEGKLYSVPSNRGIYAYLNPTKDGFNLLQRKLAYKYLYKAIEEYSKNNEEYSEVANGFYTNVEREEALVQSRKVNINNVVDVKMPDVLTVIAVDNNQNRELCEFLSKWIKEEFKVGIRYTLVNEFEFSKMENRSRYHIVLFDNMLGQKDYDFSEAVSKLMSDEEKKLLFENNYDFSKVENELFNNVILVPLMYYKENVAISNDLIKILFDGNANIQFEKIQ